MCDLPGLGLEPMSPALAGGFLTTAPPGKPKGTFLNNMEVGTNGLLKNPLSEDDPRRRIMFAMLFFQSRENND